jgi:hypothetical protein
MSNNTNSDILFITAYKDINRKTWNNYNRTNDEYFKCFLALIEKIEYTLIVYVEDDILQNLITLTSNIIDKPNIIFKNLKHVDTFFNKYVNEDKQIMSSDIYQNKIPNDRKINPEHIYSEYNFINHSKINFVRHSKQLYPNYLFYSWIDFGYIRDEISIPKNINVSTLPEKIIYHCINIPNLNERIDANTMLRVNDIYLTGSSYIIHNSLVEKFEELYELKIKEWQSKYITDDDQNLVLQLYYDNPDLFYLIQNYKWFSLYNIL